MTAKDFRLPIVRLTLTLSAVAAALPAVLTPTPARSQTTRPAPPPPPPPPAAGAASATPQLVGRNVEDVIILGNAQVPTSLIRNVIRTRPGTKYDPATVQDDYQRVFELKKFSNVEAQVEPTAAGGANVVFVCTEQKLIKKITWHGNVKVDTATLQGVSDIKVGQAIDTFRISLARQAIVNKYRDNNFPFAHVEVPGDPLTQRGELIFNIVEGPQVRIRNVRFLGNNSFTTDEVRRQIKTATWFPIFNPGKFEPETVEQDMGALRKFYADRGFFDVRIGRKLIFSPDQSELQIDFLIDEGLRYVVDRISFTGNSKLGDAQLRQGMNLRPGAYYDAETSQRDLQQIVKDYSPFGFIYVTPGQPGNTEGYLRIDPQTVFLPQPGRVEVLYRIREGNPFRVGRIDVKGNDKSQQKLVLREFRNFVPGQLYNSGEVQDALERLRSLPFFSQVSATPVGDDPNVRDLIVEVTEQRTASFTIGAGVSSNGGILGNIVFEQRNFDISNIPADWRDVLSERAFTGGGEGFRASFSPGTIYTFADVQFSEPWLFDQPYRFLEDLYLRDALREHYIDRRIGDQVTFGKYLDYNNQVAVSLRGEQVTIYSIDDPRFRPAEILEARGSHLLTSVGVQYERTTLNPGLVTYKGTLANAGVEAFGALGGDYQFERFTAGWSGYQQLYQDLLDRKTVVGFRINGGSITGRSVFFERFYGGDIGSVRGFRFRGISPRSGRGNDPVGGDFYFTGSTELSFPIFQNTFRGVVFTDFGDVENDVRFGTIRTSVGAGVRFTLPIFGQTPFAIYFAVPIVKQRHDDTQFISFSFGLNQ